MRFLQAVVHRAKSLPIDGWMLNIARISAGACFDLLNGPYRTEGMTFEIPRAYTTVSMRGKFLVDTYELSERLLVKRYLPREAAVLELGGCIGVVSCVINRLLASPERHVVVEANPFLIPVLERNRCANGARFHIEQCVVSAGRSAALAIGPTMDSSRLGGQGISVPTKTVAQIEANYALRFDTIVMDIEGAEIAFVDENPELLSRVQLLILECHQGLVGIEPIDRLRMRLNALGLRKVDQKMDTEVWLRAS
jgi:FkbM family methyltransferase